MQWRNYVRKPLRALSFGSLELFLALGLVFAAENLVTFAN